jgi:hypothetical protein
MSTNDFEICLRCGKIGYHYSVELRGFTCDIDLDSGKLQTKFNEHGNEVA